MVESAEPLAELIRRSKAESAIAERRHLEQLREGRESFRRLVDRQARSEQTFIEAWAEIAAELRINSERLEDIGEGIRANTRAVLSVLDRLEPGTR